jgi:hypothetical protein
LSEFGRVVIIESVPYAQSLQPVPPKMHVCNPPEMAR